MSASNEYHFISRWRVESTIEEVSDVLDNAPNLARWWPSVYLNVKQAEPGGAVELGRRAGAGQQSARQTS